jgi:hypothetical protein
MAKQTAALRILFGADTRQFDKALKTSIKKMQRTAADMKQIGSNLSRSLTAPLLGIAAISVKTAADFEFAMAKVQAVSGFTAGEMKRLTAQAQALGASTSKTQDEVASLQLELAKLGKSSSEIEAMTEEVLNLSIAFDQDLGETARIIGATLNQFGLDASEAGRVADNMAILFGNSALDLQKFDSAMSTVGPTANALGLSLEETGAAIGILVNAGIDASTVGTALTKSLTTMAKAGYDGQEALRAITSGNLSVAEAFEFFGDRAGKIIPVLQGTTDSLDEYITKQVEGTGAAAKARKTLEETTRGGFDKLKSAVSAAATTIGQKLLPKVNGLLDFLTKLVSKFASANPATIALGLGFAAAAASIGPLLFLGGQLVFALSQLKIALNSATAAQIRNNLAALANPYVAVTAAVVALAGGLYLLSKRQKEVETAEDRADKTRTAGLESVAEEKTEVERLAAAYKLAGDNLSKRREVLARLNQIAPETFANLDAETTGYKDLKNAVDAYTKSIQQKAILKAYEDSLVDLQAQLIQTQQGIAESIDELNGEFFEVEINGQTVLMETPASAMRFNSPQEKEAFERQTQFFIDELRKREAKLSEEMDIIKRRMQQSAERTGISLDDIFGGGGGGGGSAETATKRVEKLTPALDQLSLAFTKYNQAIAASQPRQKTMVETLDEMTKSIEEGKQLIPSFRSSLIQVGETGLTVGQQLSRAFGSLPEIVSDTFRELKEQAEDIGNTIGDALGQAFINAKKENQSFNEALKSTGREALGVILAEVVAMAIRNAFEAAGATGPLALVLAPALAGAAAGAAKSLFASTVPAFAQGGMVTGPMLSLLGDNPSGKEMVIPFERMGEFASRLLPNSNQSNDVNVHGVIQGRNLLLVHERGTRNQSRYR